MLSEPTIMIGGLLLILGFIGLFFMAWIGFTYKRINEDDGENE